MNGCIKKIELIFRMTDDSGDVREEIFNFKQDGYCWRSDRESENILIPANGTMVALIEIPIPTESGSPID